MEMIKFLAEIEKNKDRTRKMQILPDRRYGALALARAMGDNTETIERYKSWMQGEEELLKEEKEDKEKYTCEVCKKSLLLANKEKHEKTKSHIKNEPKK